MHTSSGRFPYSDRAVGFLAAAVIYAGCNGSLLTITIEETSEVVVERGTPLEVLLSDFGFDEFTGLDISSDQQLANQGVEPGDISSVYFDSLVLTASDPNGADLSFMTSLEFYASADGLPTVLVASQDDFPEGQATVEMNLEDVDLTEYAVAPSMNITTEVSGNRPDVDTTVFAEFALKVGATTQGVCNQANRAQQQ